MNTYSVRNAQKRVRVVRAKLADTTGGAVASFLIGSTAPVGGFDKTAAGKGEGGSKTGSSKKMKEKKENEPLLQAVGFDGFLDYLPL